MSGRPRSLGEAFMGASKGVLAKNARLLTPVPEVPEPAPEREADLQAQVEEWLVSRGYQRRTPKIIQRHHTGRWFVHLAQARGNPILLDLLLLDSGRGRHLEIELKAADGVLTPDQRALVNRREGALCRSLADVQAMVEAWEAVR